MMFFMGRFVGCAVITICLLTTVYPEDKLTELNRNGLLILSLIAGWFGAIFITFASEHVCVKDEEVKDFLLETDVHGEVFEKHVTKEEYLNYFVNTLAESDFKVSTKYNVIHVKDGERFPEIS